MARIGFLLLSLIQWSNVYAWSCYYDNGEDGWYLEGSMVCDGIEVQMAIEDHYCTWHRPDDPYCIQYQEPLCIDTIEYKTEACPTNYSGGRSYSRTYVCQQASWSDWTISSDNCTPNPPSCIETSESRTVACPSGYEGQITETRISSCPDPYGEPQWLDYQQTEYGCTQSVSDPVSPISVTSPTNPVTSTAIESVTVPQIDVPQTINPAEPNIESIAQEELGDSSDEVETGTRSQTDSTEEVKQDKQDGDKEQSKDNVDNVVDDRKEIVHGFGLVLSLEILNKPMEFYQPPLEDPFSIIQELPVNADTREFQLDLLKQDHIQDYYDSISNRSWKRIRSGSIY